MNAPSVIAPTGPVYHDKIQQGSMEWYEARLGLMTASEIKHVLSISGGGMGKIHKLSGELPEKMTPTREKAVAALAGREGSVSELCLIAGVSDGIIRGLIKDGVIAVEERPIPLSFKMSTDEKIKPHLYELVAQRISGYVEPIYETFDMMRGCEDEIEARILYSQKYEPVEECGFVTNSKWGFTIGYSPDGLVGDDGLIEIKSRKQKYQVQTIVEFASAEKVPEEYLLQIQTGLLVSERKWLDFISYSGGLPMATTRVYPDPVVQEAIINAAQDFEQRIEHAKTIYDAMMASGARLLPTKRTNQEMFV